MYRALFNYDGQQGDRTLTFKSGDEFNLIDQINEHWWQMQSSTGEIGLVPSTYLAINKVSFVYGVCIEDRPLWGSSCDCM